MMHHERDELLVQISSDVADIKARIEALPDHEVRLRALERFRYAFPSTALGALGVALAGVILSLTS